jgi:hypothetical protein
MVVPEGQADHGEAGAHHDEAGELEPAVAEAVHPRDGKDVAGHGGGGEDCELDGDRRDLGGARG